jgi:hypothetical protein
MRGLRRTKCLCLQLRQWVIVSIPLIVWDEVVRRRDFEVGSGIICVEYAATVTNKLGQCAHARIIVADIASHDRSVVDYC